jgi:hypothetical protein
LSNSKGNTEAINVTVVVASRPASLVAIEPANVARDSKQLASELGVRGSPKARRYSSTGESWANSSDVHILDETTVDFDLPPNFTNFATIKSVQVLNPKSRLSNAMAIQIGIDGQVMQNKG